MEFGEITETMVRKEVENLTVLTFEVTERCNLRCRYCAFGDLYYGYDERKGENLDFQRRNRYLIFIWYLEGHTSFISCSYSCRWLLRWRTTDEYGSDKADCFLY